MRSAAMFSAVFLAALVGASVLRHGRPTVVVLVLTATGFALGSRTRFQLPGRLNVHIDFEEATTTCAALLLPFGHVMVGAVVGNLVAGLGPRRPSVVLVRASVSVTGNLLGAAAVDAVATSQPGASWAGAAIVAALAQAIGSWSMMHLLVGIAEDQPVSSTPFRDLMVTAPLSIPAAALGALAAASSTLGQWPWLLVALVAAGLFVAVQLVSRSAQDARRMLTIVHLKVLVEDAATAAEILERAGVLLASVFDGYEVTIAEGWSAGHLAASVEVRDGTQLLVVPLGHPLPLDEHDLEFLDAVATTLRDALAQQARHDELEHRAVTDALTGLPNRRALDPIADQRRRFGVVLLDVNNLKAVNDTLGHHAGDELLCEVATKLSNVVRDGDVVARLGGDEFVVVTSDPSDLDGLASRLGQATSELGAPPELCVGVSLGAAVAGKDGTGLDELLAVADARMYEVKRTVPRPAGYERSR